VPDLTPFIKWCDATTVGQFVRGNTWAFPLTETIHILALAVLLGAILLLNLRLLNVWIRAWSPGHMARILSPYIWTSLIVILVTGIMLFLSEASKAYGNAAFAPKVVLLVLAMLFHYTVYRKAVYREDERPPLWAKLAACISLVLWFGVGVAGRAIGFV
jgi:hypothetical protein